MRDFKGYVKISSISDPVEDFDFETPDNATEEDIDKAAAEALWESGLIDMWYVEENDND